MNSVRLLLPDMLLSATRMTVGAKSGVGNSPIWYRRLRGLLFVERAHG